MNELSVVSVDSVFFVRCVFVMWVNESFKIVRGVHKQTGLSARQRRCCLVVLQKYEKKV